MALPDPLPDNPKKWEGWRDYQSPDPYRRLGLSFEEAPGDAVIEESSRRLLIWWQKKLPLKNQPSNPIAQMLRAGLEEAPRAIAEARTQLLHKERRASIDLELREQSRKERREELRKYLEFAISDGLLPREAERRLYEIGRNQGFDDEETAEFLRVVLDEHGAELESSQRQRQNGAKEAGDPEKEFLRMLRLAGLEEEGDMTDDQRDAFINMAENLGIQPARAEDMVDDFLDEIAFGVVAPAAPAVKTPKKTASTNPVKPAETPRVVQFPPLDPEGERQKFRPFSNRLRMEMRFIPSGIFMMGGNAPGTAPNEQPVHQVYVSRFFMARYPVTHAQFEIFDQEHARRRPEWAGDDHPVVYVSSEEARKFCEWLSKKEGRSYRLPTEAEWEYAARGNDGRLFPWGNHAVKGKVANFADRNTAFAWSDHSVDDGWAQTSPVGKYPAGASPFGIEELSGNVWEWCNDFYDSYKPGKQADPTGPKSGARRVYRGGSWRSRFANLRATARSFNNVNYLYHDVGFRVVCEA